MALRPCFSVFSPVAKNILHIAPNGQSTKIAHVAGSDRPLRLIKSARNNDTQRLFTDGLRRAMLAIR
jgi:hypothetical protein